MSKMAVAIGIGMSLLAAVRPAQAAGGIGCVALEVASPGTPRYASGTPQFSATEVIDLTFRLHTSRNIKGDHVAQFRVMTPQNHLYQAIDVPVVDPSGEPGHRTLPGYPFPVKEKKPVPSMPKGVAAMVVETSFPVGGTSIVSRGIYGRWSVSAFLDNGPQPLCTPVSFSIVP